MRLRRHHSKSWNSLEVAVAADESCAHGERGCSHPEVVLIQRQTAELLRDFDICILITSGWRDRLARYFSE